MRYIRRRWFPARYRRPKGKRIFARRLAALAVCLSVLWLALSELGLLSLSEGLTQEAAESYLLSCVSCAIEQELTENETSFVTVSRLPDGEVASVSANTEALNRLRAGVLERLSGRLNGKATSYIPIGSLTKVGIFNGRGPKVPVKLQLEGSADVSFQTEFLSAGINQTCHRITMTVRVSAFSQSKRFQVQTEKESTTVLSETVVVGRVPEAVLPVGQSQEEIKEREDTGRSLLGASGIA